MCEVLKPCHSSIEKYTTDQQTLPTYLGMQENSSRSKRPVVVLAGRVSGQLFLVYIPRTSLPGRYIQLTIQRLGLAGNVCSIARSSDEACCVCHNPNKKGFIRKDERSINWQRQEI